MPVNVIVALAYIFSSAAYRGPVQPCNIELTGGDLFVNAPFLPVALGLKAAQLGDLRVLHPDAKHWEWYYDARTDKVLARPDKGKPKVVHASCRALDADGRRDWVNQGGGEDVPAATLVCTLNSGFKNGTRTLVIAMNPDLEVLAAKQLWREDEGMMLCHLPRKPPSP